MSPLRSDGLRDSQALKTKLSPRWAIRLKSTQIRWFCNGQAGSCTALTEAKGTKKKGGLENNSKKPSDLT